jgi:hypothetical protein
MHTSRLLIAGALTSMVVVMGGLQGMGYAQAQDAEQTSAAVVPDAVAPEPLDADELEILVARIALYPDELVAVIASSSLYPLQVVQAARYLDKVKSKPDLKPDESWDGSVVSLMNYPEIVTMMSDDLEWTEALGEAITNQQKDVLEAIQQLRDKAVAMDVLKSDEKTKVVVENDTIVIQPANAETVYVPQYPPEMLYEPEYLPAPITYYPEPYPSYYYPTAPYFAAFVTGAVWGAVVDWDDWGVWGGNGRWDNDIDIDCNNCFNGNGNIDWKKVDHHNLKFDKAKFNNLDRGKFKNDLKANDRNNIRNKGNNLKRSRASTLPAGGRQVKDVRKSTLEGLKAKPGNKMAKSGNRAATTNQGIANSKAGQGAANRDRPGGSKATRPAGKAKPAARADTRPRNPSPVGDMNRGRTAKSQSNRGAKSMGGGINRGSSMKKRPIPRGGGARRR